MMNKSNQSIRFFDQQFQQQVRDADYALNPFERAALPYLHGRVLDFGCGMGNLAIEAARNGCSVVALDASQSAIDHIQRRAANENLAVEAHHADLTAYEITESFDAVVCIGLLMFFDCPSAYRSLAQLQAKTREGGAAIVNVLVAGTTYLDMFEQSSHCLFGRTEIEDRFTGWDIAQSDYQSFEAPRQRIKAFSTVIARKPERIDTMSTGYAG